MLDLNNKIYMMGYAGSLGAARFASSNMDMLKARFREDYIEEQMALLAEDCKADYGTEVISVIDEIYRISQEEKRGLEIRLRDIPIRQFTIEICELAGLDPYHLETRARIWLADDTLPCESCRIIGNTYEGLDVILKR